jgi:cobalamin biosynthesis protein CobD/CbiB
MIAKYYIINGTKIARYEYSLTSVCDKLHGYLTGSGGDVPQAQADDLAGFLTARLQDWTICATDSHWLAYDEAIRHLCLTTLACYHQGEHIYRKDAVRYFEITREDD